MAITRQEELINSVASDITPITREEQYLSYIGGGSSSYPTEPITRKEFLLKQIAENGVSGGGATHYQHIFRIQGSDWMNSHLVDVAAIVISTRSDRSTDFGDLADMLNGVPCSGTIYDGYASLPAIYIDGTWYNDDDGVWKIGVWYMVDGIQMLAEILEVDVSIDHEVREV